MNDTEILDWLERNLAPLGEYRLFRHLITNGVLISKDPMPEAEYSQSLRHAVQQASVRKD